MINSATIIGLGKLGAPMLAVFAAKGLRVVGVDLDPAKMQAIRSRVAPVDETGLGQLLRSANQPGSGIARPVIETEARIEDAVRFTDATFIVTATPSGPDGKFSLAHVIPACEAIGRALKEKDSFHIVVLTSTVAPGATQGPVREALERTSGKVAGVDFGLCYNPEFIALGTVIRDFQNPDFVLIGESDQRSGAELAQLYERVCDNHPVCQHMNFINAEITKLALNTFITTKISYANMLARICERLPGANVDVVTNALGFDTRIGGKCLKGAVPYGGPCFPRDNRALVAVAREAGIDASIARVTDEFNRSQLKFLANIVQSYGGHYACVLGLSYKPGTKICEEAVGTLLADELHARGMKVLAYDTWKVGDLRDTLKLADVIILAMPFEGIGDLPIISDGKKRTVIDCWRLFPKLEYVPEINYVPLGIGA